MRKPRSDAKLKTLPEEKQAELMVWLREPKSGAGPGGVEHARSMCASRWGLSTSHRALTEFRAWREVVEDYRESTEIGDAAAEMMRGFKPGQEEEAEKFGSYVFTRRAIGSKDTKAFVAMQRLRLDQESARTKAEIEREKLRKADRRLDQAGQALALAERRVQLLEDNAAKAKEKLHAVKSKGGLTKETLRQIEEAAGLL